MSIFDIKIAGMTFHVSSQFSGCMTICEKFLINEPGEHNISITLEDIKDERIACANDHSADESLQYASDEFIETIAFLRKLANYVVDYNRILMHGSAIAVDGKGYIFTARSGTGKSTHTKLLRRLLGVRTRMVNDDKPFVYLDGDTFYVCGTPWMGKHKLGNNITVPLAGIFFLRRSDENVLETLSADEALPLLLSQCHRPVDAMKMLNTLEIIDKLLQNVPLYDLGCNMDISAAHLSSSVMK